ncbi:RDD family protein [Terracidiphilus gabretensis]|uniref:RDD family protein n=1 Tax=Terracidiphilus gabretensis TaxID=1577687 RepID=UPI00071B9A87|nr:RDD family protein [Terracidiphilus gabretensis]
MSTLGQPIAPEWRQEVNRRLAEHKNRKVSNSDASAPVQPIAPGASRAAQAAARVAARYAQAKSYSQMQAEEARMAVRAAEIATQVALEAQSAAESALAGLHAASVEAPARPVAPVVTMSREAARQPEPPAPAEWEWRNDTLVPEQVANQPLDLHTGFYAEPYTATTIPETVAPAPLPEPPSGPVTSAKDGSGNLLHIRWEPDMPLREAATFASEPLDLSTEDWFTPAETAHNQHEPLEIEAHTIHANLIHFPRELVATRRMRPRLAEGITQPEQPGSQLSIFEVDPGSVQAGLTQIDLIQAETPDPTSYPDYAQPESHTEPASEPVAASQAVRQPAALPSVPWSTPVWHGMKLDAQAVPASAFSAQNKPALAGLNRRLMAGTVDIALVTAIASFLWFTMALGMASPLVPRTAELLGAGIFALAGLSYHAFFCLLSLRTPGMRYAGLSLCTFDDCIPSPEQMRRRLGAMTVSMLPLGLGMLWSLFDEDRLSWHDRYSQTYLRHS